MSNNLSLSTSGCPARPKPRVTQSSCIVSTLEVSMKPSLFAHPFASYCQKVLIALYENGTAFTYRKIGPEDPTAMSELTALWPLNKFPLLLDEGHTYLESSIIIEHLAIRHPGPVQLIPKDPETALETRMLDRFFDNYVMTPMQRIVADFMRATSDRDPIGVQEARALLDTSLHRRHDIVVEE